MEKINKRYKNERNKKEKNSILPHKWITQTFCIIGPGEFDVAIIKNSK